MANEAFIQFIWKHGLYNAASLSTASGQALHIEDPGEHNLHAGPDFFNARIRLNKILWAGNVEIHWRASDWYRHGHHLDPAYNNVVLHVVGDYDTDVTNSLGRRIQTMVPEYHRNLAGRYKILKMSESWLPCEEYIKHIPMDKVKTWLNSLQAERLDKKAGRIKHILHDSGKSMDEALYLALGPGYGIPLNVLPFELLVKGVPYAGIMPFRDSSTDLEAILFGHSGLLFPARMLGPYPSSLWNRYRNHKTLFEGRTIPLYMWKFLRLRPASFPSLRISQFASLIHQRFPLAESLLRVSSLGELEQLFRAGASEYWTTHYLFGKSSAPLPKFPGEEFISILLINVIVPFLHALARTGKPGKKGRQAHEILVQIKAESNRLIRNWAQYGICANNALESQALLQLYYVYCKQKRCLDCRIGAESIKAALYEKI